MKTNEEYLNFRSSAILFLLGQFFYVLSAFSSISTFKFLPSWLSLFQILADISFIFFFIALLKVRKKNKSFFYGLMTFIVLVTVTLINDICGSSTSGYYLSLTRAFNWSIKCLLAIMYFYYFQGAYIVFNENESSHHFRKTKAMCIIFLSLFGSYLFLTLVSKLPFLMSNIIANRIFYYGLWIMSLVIHVYVLAICVNVLIGVIKLGKEDNNEQRKEDEPLQ